MSNRIRVLHVDDEPDFSDLTTTCLERVNNQFAVHTALSADEGLDRLATDTYDCVVSDYDMPGKDGIEFLRAVREDFPDIPFILFTGKGSEEVASDAISAGVTDYLRKRPGTDQFELLANRITNAVNQLRAEQQLQQERERFRTLFERLSQATVEVEYNDDGEPIVQRVNPAFEETFGYDTEDIIGDSLDEYIVPEDRTDEATQINQRVQAGGRLKSEEVTRQTTADAREFLLQNAVYNGGSGGFAIYTDITKRKERERELERQNTRLRALFENFPEPTIAYTYEGDEPHVASVNDAFTEIFGYEPDTAVGEHIDELIVPPERRDEAQRVDDRVQAGDLLDEELRREAADGLRDFHFRNIRLPDDEYIDGYGIYSDITAYKERERELARQNDLFTKAQDIADVGAWEYDLQADEAFWTGQIYDIHDLPQDFEPTPEKGISFYHPDDQDRIREAFEAAVESGDPYDVEARLLTMDDELRWVRTRGDPQIEDGTVVSVRGTIQDITDRKLYEQRLERRSTAIEASMDGMAILNEQGEYLYVNQAHADVYGYDDPESFIGESWRMCYEEEAISRMEAEVLPAVEADGEWRGEAVGYRNDGTTFPQEVSLTVTDAGEIICVVRDITDRKQREQKLQETNRQLNAVLDTVEAAIFIKNTDGQYELMNQECRKILGVDEDAEVVGTTDYDFFPENIADQVRADDQRVLETGETQKYEEELPTDQGTRSHLTLKSPLYDEEGTPVGICAVSTDITERKQRRQELIELERAVEMICENVPIIFFTFDADGLFTRSQGKALDRIGFEPDEVVGKSVFDLYKDHSEIVAQCERALAGEHVSATVEIADGVFETHYAPIVDDGEVVAVTGHKFDVTEYKQREEELERQNKRLDEFVSVVSHDLRNPLNVASARAELVREECDSPHLTKLIQAHERMESLIDDLLQVAREGDEITEAEPVQIATLSEDCWQTVATGDATIQIKSDRRIRADRSRLAQLVENLIRNAVEHGGSDVTVTVGELDAGFYIADDGPGIPESERETIFEMGYSSHADGTGFGLTIVKRIVKAHGWDIGVTDSAAGGARFEITGVEFIE